VFCIANQKGGVGKTTTAVNLAAGLAKAGSKTLLIDLDPQCNATTGMGLSPTERHALATGEPIHSAVSKTYLEQLALLKGSRRFQDVEMLAGADSEVAGMIGQQLETGLNAYDYVLIDCPPSLGTITQMALRSSNEVLMPIQCEYFAMEGLTQMIHVIRDVMQDHPGRLEFGGILLTMYDASLELTAEVAEEVREFFGEIVFETVVPRDVAVAEAPSHGRSVLDYAPRTRGARAYTELCMEVLER